MTAAALAFACGAALLQLQGTLPAPAWLAAAPVLLALAWLRPKLAFLAALGLGFLWAAMLAQHRLADRLAPELEGVDLSVVGVVSSLPALTERGARFEFDVESSEGATRRPEKILLSWYRSGQDEDAPALLASAVHPGERWAFTVRLRRPHGSVNPYGFDYEAWLLERGVGATGYVRARGEQRRLGARNSTADRIEQAREAVRTRILQQLGATPAAGILVALAVGDQRAISAEEWRLFNLTGVTHLMSISGLHVTLISGLLAWLVALGWRRVPALALRLPARKAAAVAAIAGAFGYTLLAGFGVPAQRTFYMVAVVALALWSGRVASPLRVLSIALAVVVLLDPWAPLAPGLWLSFGAVLLIFYVGTGWNAAEPRVAQWARTQWAITVGLAPAALLLFGQLSLAGPLANAIAIPLVSVVITPLALAAAALPVDALLDLAAWLVEWLLQFLEWCASLPAALWQQHVPPLWTVLLALLGASWLIAPAGFAWRSVGAALMAPAFVLLPPGPAQGEAWVTTFDVGQGLAVLVRTASRTLLYDAGPVYAPEADSGGRIILPALRGAGLARLDAVVLSHEDADHIGGALSVLESMEVDLLYSSLAPSHPLNALAQRPRSCAAGMEWAWDGVRFALLHPQAGILARKRNDLSCVLRIVAGGKTLLLTGDIERAAEAQLVQAGELKSTVLVVPHHGSRTSSTAAFVAATAPRIAIVPVGYRNRFGHPAAEVLARYREAGSEIARTDIAGALTVRLSEGPLTLESERRRRERYWLQ